MKTLFSIFQSLLISLLFAMLNGIEQISNHRFTLTAVSQNPITGRARGTFAGAVFTTWKGLNVFKAKPVSVRNPNTQAQQDQRNKFTLVQDFCSAVLSLVRIGFQKYQNGQTAYNEAISRNIQNAIEGSSPNFSLDYSELVISEGALDGQPDASVTSWVYNDLSIEWTSIGGQGNAQDTDLAYALFLYAGSDLSTKVKAVLGTNDRSEEITGATVPTSWQTETGHAYLFFVSADGTLISDTTYCGTGTITAS